MGALFCVRLRVLTAVPTQIRFKNIYQKGYNIKNF
nr:MAG TPA: hypothetical protein [Caudoviricetes sp.]